MAKAAAAEQLRLLELQALDAKIKQLDHRTRTLRQDPRLSDLQAGLSVANSDLVVLNTEVADVQRQLSRAEADVEQVATRIARDEAKLNSGSGLSKDLMALQNDLASLAKRRSSLEDTELEVMERLEAATAKAAKQQGVVDDIKGSLDGIRAELDGQLVEVAAEREATVGDRGELAGSFDPALLAVYERTLTKRGVGAARLFHGTSEGSGMQLSPGDLADIRKAADDDIVFCPDSGAILVRNPEWT
ncbi:DNA-binding protein [Paenarthrobacter sp. Z7-10]|uniref:zinc ribbon domain-containing protein n=1 Tax=Paenarthrobacter sp. Z7-10 TaxID=2787635 RepID=UPI0022A9D175|nr:C4-type zinc ribbon domain-containing protein [Paenarthrobacter sp. Z7-10]MCZ2403812.1 DNA-binding protein [Paenarthrobacter sp. Z7-10]